MLTQELKIPKDIEIKFYRLTLPSFNTSNLPLSGIYQNIDTKEEKDFSFTNKFSNFDLSNSMGIENLFTGNLSFGKVYLNEKLDGLISFANISDNYVTIRDLEISIIIGEKQESKKKENKEILDIKLPPDGVQINPKQAHTIKMNISLDYVSKYTIDINLKTRSAAYNTIFNNAKIKGLVKDYTKEYRIVNGNVESFNNKRLTFDVNNPFKITEKFYNHQMNACYIETKIKNISIYPLTIYNLCLIPKSKTNLKISELLLSNNKFSKIPLVQTLEEINKVENENLDKNIQESLKSRLLTIESEEEINLLFLNKDPNLFETEAQFVLEINWLNLFDPNPRKFSHEFNNILNTYNNFYKITVVEKPKGNIIQNENFNIILKLETKNPEKKYIITLSQEPLQDNDKSTDREIEIIDIIEKKIELSNEKKSANFMLICKSDILGNVYLPRLKFLVYEEKNINPIGNVYDTLLFFNCIKN